MSKVYILSRTIEPPTLLQVAQDFAERGHIIELAPSMADWMVMLSSCEQELDSGIINYATKNNIRLDIIGYKPSIHNLNGKKKVTFYSDYNNFVRSNFLTT